MAMATGAMQVCVTRGCGVQGAAVLGVRSGEGLGTGMVAFRGLRARGGLVQVRAMPPVEQVRARGVRCEASAGNGGAMGGRNHSGMNVVFVSAEVAPWSKTGGLGDVLGGLPPALAVSSHLIHVIGYLPLTVRQR